MPDVPATDPARLLQAAGSLLEVSGPHEVAPTALRVLRSAFGTHRSGMALVDTERQELVGSCATNQGRHDYAMPLERGPARQVIESGEPLLLTEESVKGWAERDPLCERLPMIIAPLKHREETLGIVGVGDPQLGDFPEDAPAALKAMGEMVARTLLRAHRVGGALEARALCARDLEARMAPLGLDLPGTAGPRERLEGARREGRSVLLRGEPGCGKEMLVRGVHAGFKGGRLGFAVAEAGSASDEAALAAELFGREQDPPVPGLVERLGNGTLLIEEMSSFPPALQERLARLAQTGEFHREGSTTLLRAHLWLVAATRREPGVLHPDVVPAFGEALVLPPLRDRRADIVPLAKQILTHLARTMGRPVPALDPAAEPALEGHAWPGNARELRLVLERALVFCISGRIGRGDLQGLLEEQAEPAVHVEAGLPLQDAVQAFKRARIERALNATGGNQTRAAALLGVRQPNLSRLMATLGMRPARSARPAKEREAEA